MTKYSDPLRLLAETIDKLPESEFGGAFVIVLPISANESEPRVVKAIVSGTKDIPQLMSMLQGQAQIIVNEEQIKSTHPHSFPQRRG